jgi:hypothetical protein
MGKRRYVAKCSCFLYANDYSSSRLRKLAAIEDLSSYIRFLSTSSILRMQSPFHVSSATRISPRRRWHSPQLRYVNPTFDIGDADLSIRSTMRSGFGLRAI